MIDESVSLRQRAAIAVREADDEARRNDVKQFVKRAKVGRTLLRKVLDIESDLSDWQPLGREAVIEVDGIRLHTWRTLAYFGGVQDTLRYGEHDVLSVVQLGRLIERETADLDT